jgi:titin
MASSDVDLVINSDPVFLGTFRTDSDGVLRASVTIPAGLAAGAHTIVATGVNAANQPVTASIGVTVSASPTSAGSALPTTGADIAAALTVGLALIAAGTTSVIAGRKHRTGSTR